MPSTANSVHRTRLPNQPVSAGQVAGYVGGAADSFGGVDPATVPPSNIASANIAAFAAGTALAAPAGGTGTAAGGYDTAGNRDLMIAAHNALRTDVNAIRAALIAAGLMAPS